MRTTSEIWIDESRAVITSVTDSGQTTLEVWAQTECQRSLGPLEGDTVLDEAPGIRQSAAHRQHFYVEVIAAIGDAMTILIFGPGEAKTELRNRLGQLPGGVRIHAMEAVGRMTDRQIADRARDHVYT